MNKHTPGPWSAWIHDETKSGFEAFDTPPPDSATGAAVWRLNDDQDIYLNGNADTSKTIVPDNGISIATHREINRGVDIHTGEPEFQELVPLRPYDALLIAAAPDLLAACEDALTTGESEMQHILYNGRLRRVLRAAVKKAKGEQS